MSDAVIQFRILKKSGTHADVFTAVGLADLLQSLFTEAVELVDEGGFFVVVLPAPLPKTLEHLTRSPRYPWLRTAAAGEISRSGMDVVDMTREFERLKRWSENRQRLRSQRNPDPELVALVQQDSPIQRWRILAPMTNTKLKAVKTWNRVAEAIADTTDSEFITQVLEGLDAVAANIPSRATWGATSNGLFCPSQIKGFNEVKPGGTSRGSMSVDTFEEWLRYQGYWRCANVVSDADNIRVYVPIPKGITSRALGRLSLELEKQPLPGCGVKSDVLATIALAQLLIQHSNEYHSKDTEPFPGLSLGIGDTPADLVSGLYVTHYTKTSRQAYGVKSMSVLSLPDWFPIRSSADAEDWLAILDEHHRIVRSLREDRSDEIGLLIDYRTFLEKRGEPALWALLEFMKGYGTLVMRANGTKQDNRMRWMLRFSDLYFRRVLMGASTHMIQIVNDPGFEAVARAVRQVTVISQNRRARGKDVWREIRYELLHDLHRSRKVPGNAFVECVMEFVSRYNYENARHREVEKDIRAAPANVSDEELKAFLALLDQHGTAVVGALLAAYGTCKEKWEEEASDISKSSNAEAEDVSQV